jgi:hypothetical protein
MTSSFELWQKLPTDFLKRKYPGWCQLDYDVQCLVVELAVFETNICFDAPMHGQL